jgi:para-nitrobenzyl esterase
VRENIVNFGGDPKTVMIFGQSGGGAKTSTVLAMPSARGLFHRAAIQSGAAVRLLDRDEATRTAELVLKELNLTRDRIADIQQLPFEAILEAQRRVASEESAGFRPVVDGRFVPQHPFDPTGPAVSADIPLIVSTTLDDGARRTGDFNMDVAALRAFLDKEVGAQAGRVLDAYRKAYPQASPYLLQARILTDRAHRRRANTLAERKVEQKGAPIWMYRFDWPSPAFGGKFGAVHAVDVEFVFHNQRTIISGNTPEARQMAHRMASSWVAFARTGNPNNPTVPHWPAYDLTNRATMIFDNQTRVVNGLN